MCELFALNSNVPTSATFAFTGLSARGGRTGEHADGWGMAFHGGDACRVFLDDAPACDSPLASFLRQHPLRAPTVMAHVRKATQGSVSLANCHPFQREWGGRHWVFMHNGDLKGFDAPLDGSFRPVGQTDSEHAFCWLMQQLRTRYGRSGLPVWPELAPALAAWAARLAAHGSFNMMLSDGRALFAHASTKLAWLQRQHPFKPTQLVDCELGIDLAAANHPGERMVLLATAALTRDEPWQPFAPGEARVFAQGRCIWERAPQPLAGGHADRPAQTTAERPLRPPASGRTRLDEPAMADEVVSETSPRSRRPYGCLPEDPRLAAPHP